MRLVIAISVVLATAASACGDAPAASPTAVSPTAVITTVGGDVIVVDVVIADSEAEREQGLMDRTALPDDAGMVFLFDGETTASFWMKDTRIPLSIAFWDADGAIVGILDMEPCTADPCPTYGPGVAYVGALEVNRGFFADRGVSAGDRIRIDGAA